MSLKAKIEAVIYASEEPVTLAQLTGLLGEEAQAELDALASQQQSLALDDLFTSDQDALNAETLVAADHPPAADHPEAASLPPDLSSRLKPNGDTQPIERSSRPERSGVERPAVDEATEPGPIPDDKAIAAALKQKERRLRDYFRSLLDELILDYASDARGLEIREVAGGFRLATKPEYHDAVRGFVKSLKPPLKLSLQALETLAVVAYKQPVTSPEVSEIRGVDSAGVLGSLMARKLVTTAGRKPVIGRPILYKTTRDFLLCFGLKDIQELPSIEEFEKMAGELNAAVRDPIQEEIPMNPPEEQTPVEERTSVLDERKSALQPTNIHHDTTEDLMSDKSTALEGRNHEHADIHEVEPLAGPGCESGAQSQLRAEDGDDTENMADEVVIDGRISGPPPSYADDSPSAQEAQEQDEKDI